VPTVSNNTIGNRVNRQSRLDARVTIPPADRSLLEVIQSVIAQVREQTGVHVTLGNVPENMLRQKRVSFGTTNQRARDVLVQVLAATGENLSWRLQCDPGSTKFCFFSIHSVPTPK
jgi:hypothetical protein